MKNIISVNKKFMEISPKQLIEIIKEFYSVSGIEIFINCNEEKEIDYLEKLVFEIKNSNLILQVHSDIECSLEEQIKYLKKLEEYSNYLNKKIVVTFHSVYDINKEISINKTKEYMRKIIENITSDNLILCLENLNNLDKEYRLKKEDLSKVVENEDLFLTYDMGHELEEFGKINYPDNHIFNKIRNIHIHDSNDGIDHYPIYNSSINFNIILNGIKYLKDNNYKYNIVYEYDLYKCSGDTIIDKVKDYLNSIENIK